MAGFAGIISLDTMHPREKVHTMLSWCKPKRSFLSFNQQSTIHTHRNACIGIVHTSFATSQDQSICAGICGELLRKEKLLDAIKKKSNLYAESDAELLLLGYEVLGQELFSYLDGDFICVILDGKKNELYIARDRMGTYNLFWHTSPHAIVFSTSLKALLSTGTISPSCDTESIATYLSLGYISQDKTPIQGVNRLLPGYFLKLSLQGKLSILPFWSLSSCFSKSKWRNFESTQELYEQLEQTITQAIRIRQKLEYPQACIYDCNQGSDLIEHLFVKGRNSTHIPMHAAFFESFDPHLSQKYTPSSPRSQAAHSQTLIIPKMFFKNIIPMIWETEMPTADLDALPCWHFADWCHTHNLSAYFDSGFHEAFYNYAAHVPGNTDLSAYKNSHHKKSDMLLRIQDSLYSFLIRLFPTAAFNMMRRSQTHDFRLHFLEHESVIPRHELLHAAPSFAKLFEPDLFLHQFYHLPKILSAPASLFYLQMKTQVIDKIHSRRSASARAFGIRSQAPLLDEEVVAFLASLHEAIWASPDILPGFTQYALSSSLRLQPAPSSHLQTFSSWKNLPQMKAIFQALQEGLLVESGSISSSWLQKQLTFQKPESMSYLYSLLILELWMQLFIDLPLSPSNGDISVQDLLFIPSFSTLEHV
jgi:hypothetical protein